MPFKSIAQRKFMFAKHPTIAKRWVKKYGARVKANGKSRYSEALSKKC